MSEPFARVAWVCSECGNETEEYDGKLVCEICGHVFVIVDQTRAVYSPELTEEEQ